MTRRCFALLLGSVSLFGTACKKNSEITTSSTKSFDACGPSQEQSAPPTDGPVTELPPLPGEQPVTEQPPGEDRPVTQLPPVPGDDTVELYTDTWGFDDGYQYDAYNQNDSTYQDDSGSYAYESVEGLALQSQDAPTGGCGATSTAPGEQSQAALPEGQDAMGEFGSGPRYYTDAEFPDEPFQQVEGGVPILHIRNLSGDQVELQGYFNTKSPKGEGWRQITWPKEGTQRINEPVAVIDGSSRDGTGSMVFGPSDTMTWQRRATNAMRFQVIDPATGQDVTNRYTITQDAEGSVDIRRKS